MTIDNATISDNPVEDSPRVPRQIHYGSLGFIVAQRVGRLYQGKQQKLPWARATLAHLRNNIARPPGIDPSIWSLTIEGIPGTPRADRPDDPTPEEYAAHVALTLFALHQQSREQSEHQEGIGLGRAIAHLQRVREEDQDPEKSPVRRRFNAVITASSLTEVTYHLRGLVSEMRTAEVHMDYGMLADDLLTFQRPGGADRVKRTWARQLYSLNSDSESAPSTTPNQENNPEESAND